MYTLGFTSSCRVFLAVASQEDVIMIDTSPLRNRVNPLDFARFAAFDFTRFAASTRRFASWVTEAVTACQSELSSVL